MIEPLPSTVTTYASKEPPIEIPISGPPTTRRAPLYLDAIDAAEAADALFSRDATASTMESNLESEPPVPPERTAK